MINKKGIKNLILEDIKTPIILYEDKTDIDNVVCEFTNEYKYFSEEAKQFIDKLFEERKKNNEKIFNGLVYGLTNFEVYGRKIFLSFEKGDYKTYLATMDNGYKKYILENNFFILPIGICGVITTKDNKLIFAGETKFCNSIKFLSGFVSVEDITQEEQINILHVINRECKEEIGDLKLFNNSIIGAIKTNCCTFVTNHDTNYTSNEIKEIYKNNTFEDKYEMENMFFMDNDEKTIEEMIMNSKLNEVGKIALRFYLKEKFSNYKFMHMKL